MTFDLFALLLVATAFALLRPLSPRARRRRRRNRLWVVRRR